ncbi:MAG: class I SAM-dependent methyltransferase [Acidobacteriota bacterium]
MSAPDRDQRAAAVPPHPHLDRYYSGGEQGRRSFVRSIFDGSASDYDRVERFMALGSGSWYRRKALERAALRSGDRVLDVAMGTGLVAREAIEITGDPGAVIGLDPSVGMVAQARRSLSNPALLAVGEAIPVRDGSFDLLSMGYALRHLSDLAVTFREFHRVLRPGGRVLILEMTPPRSPIGRALLRAYVRGVVPLLARPLMRSSDTGFLWQYFWDTVETCVPPGDILDALESVGFINVRRTLVIGMFSEYTGVRPGPGIAVEPLRPGGTVFERVMPR